MTERDISGNEDREQSSLGSAVPSLKCGACRGTRFVPAPADNAWRVYFRRIGQTALAHNVSVPCPDCYGNASAALSTRAVRPGPSFPQSSPEAGEE